MLKREFLNLKMKEIGLDLSEQQSDQFELFYEDLIEKNRVMNLTAITEWEDVVVKHFVDSLAILKYSDLFQNPVRVIDVGTGAGFPGIPLAIVFPEADIVLVDSVGKKVSFLEKETEKLGLTHVCAIHGRVEDLARQSEYREKFDISVSRAVANLSTLSEYCLPFVKKGGSFIAYKSGNCQEEMKVAEYAIKQLAGKISRIDKYQIEESVETEETVEFEKSVDNKICSKAESFSRTLIEVRKVGVTPAKFPRKAGIPSKTPLIH